MDYNKMPERREYIEPRLLTNRAIESILDRVDDHDVKRLRYELKLRQGRGEYDGKESNWDMVPEEST